MRIVFFGSDDFATAHLKGLVDNNHEVLSCVTPPDRARGRGMEVQSSSVKVFAESHNISVLQPESLKPKEIEEGLRMFEADLFVVIAYGRILPQNILDIPEYGAINVHGSLLPKYRGAGPINWAILNGEQETGLSIIQMNAKMDAGDVLSQHTIDIKQDDTAITLRVKMMEAGVGLLNDTIAAIEVGQSNPTPQDESLVTLAPKLTKDLGVIDWSKSASIIHNQVRGLLPWPSAYTQYEGKMLKILSTEVMNNSTEGASPGQVIDVKADHFVVATAEGSLKVNAVHLANAKPMEVKDFLLGYKIETGYQFS